MKYAWIEKESDSWPLERVCSVLGVSTSGYNSQRRGGASTKRLSDLQLLTLIRSIYEESKRAYGSPRILGDLKEIGIPAGKNRVERLMKENGIKSRVARKFRLTTDSKHNLPVSPNLLARNFTAERPDQVWTADLTYIWTGESWLYLAVVLDLYSRMIVGWSMGERMTRDLVINALRMACMSRRPQPGLLHHSDRGSQYCSAEYRKVLEEYQMISSMSRKGDCWDNAVTESFFGSLKKESVHGNNFKTRDEARKELFSYIELFYNHKRKHSSLGYRSPAAFYATWLNQNRLAA